MRLFFPMLATLLMTLQMTPKQATHKQVAPEQAMPAAYTRKNLIIATDLDDVVLKRRNGRIAAIVFKNIFQLIPMYSKFRENKKTAGDSTGQKYGEGFYLYLVKNGEHRLAKIVKKVCTRKRLKKKTVKVMQKLSNKGYDIFTATNVGSLFFKKLQKKFSDVFNTTFIRHGLTVDFAQEDIIQKPDPRYFEALKAKLNPNGDKQILFIDDKLENVEAARNAGLLAIHFKGHKQLKKELKKYGLLA